MITRQDSLSTSDERIDSQHLVLIEQFNKLEEIMNTRSGAEFRKGAGEVLDFLQFYATWHFAEEEKLMEELQCPITAENKRQHAEFLTLFGEFYERWQNSVMDMELARPTHQTVSNWILNHIQKVDTHLRDCK